MTQLAIAICYLLSIVFFILAIFGKGDLTNNLIFCFWFSIIGRLEEIIYKIRNL